MQFETWVLLQPLLEGGGLVRRAVIQVHMQIQFGGRAAVDLLQERQTFLGSVTLSDSPDNLASRMCRVRVRCTRFCASEPIGHDGLSFSGFGVAPYRHTVKQMNYPLDMLGGWFFWRTGRFDHIPPGGYGASLIHRRMRLKA